MTKFRANLKNYINSFCCVFPLSYRSLLAWQGRPNLSKQVFLSVIQRGNTVFDVGANEGDYTLLFSHLVGRSGLVHAFEPVPSTFSRLTGRVRTLQRFPNVVLNERAVGETESRRQIFIPGSDAAQASIIPHQAGSGSWSASQQPQSIDVAMVPLDRYCEQKNIPAIHFLKLDIEGAELLALRGAARSLEKFRPVIFLELSRDWIRDFQYSELDLLSYLQGHHYDLFYLIDNRIRAVEHPEDDLDSARLPVSVDLLCFNSDRHHSVVRRLQPCVADGR